MGRAKARVFPEPVCEPPIQSRPDRIGGIVVLWIDVGFRIERELRVWVSHGDTPREANVVVAEVTAVEVDEIPELPFVLA